MGDENNQTGGATTNPLGGQADQPGVVTPGAGVGGGLPGVGVGSNVPGVPVGGATDVPSGLPTTGVPTTPPVSNPLDVTGVVGSVNPPAGGPAQPGSGVVGGLSNVGGNAVDEEHDEEVGGGTPPPVGGVGTGTPGGMPGNNPV